MKHQRNCTRKPGRRRGATLVEFAFVAPIVFAMFFASIEFSRANMLRHAIESAAYEGCRAVIIPGATAADAIASANATLSAASAVDATVTVDPATITKATKNVTVTVSLPLNNNTWVTPAFLVNSTLTTSINMNREYLDEYSNP
jgi:Flp pilus assembly protein TadG